MDRKILSGLDYVMGEVHSNELHINKKSDLILWIILVVSAIMLMIWGSMIFRTFARIQVGWYMHDMYINRYFGYLIVRALPMYISIIVMYVLSVRRKMVDFRGYIAPLMIFSLFAFLITMVIYGFAILELFWYLILRACKSSVGIINLVAHKA